MSDWRPGISRAALQARAEMLARIRRFFADRQVLEVDTPLLASYGVTDPALEPLQIADGQSLGGPRFLQTSPEFAMKRLLAAGSGDIYQLGRAFRDGEVGRRHNPEFTMLEWYRTGFTSRALMEEVAALVMDCLERESCSYRSYTEVFQTALALDPMRAPLEELRRTAARHLDVGNLQLDRDGWLDLLMSHCIEPSLADQGIVFVYDYPASQAALARCHDGDGRSVADRFELYVDGLELANGYRELLDPGVLDTRAREDNRRRREAGQQPRELDPRLREAMHAGLPDCSGVALGVDRLLMRRLAVESLAGVMPFDWSRS